MNTAQSLFRALLVGSALFAGLNTYASVGGPIRPLANEFVVLGESPDPMNAPLYTPTVLRLNSGRLLAAYEAGKGGRVEGQPFAWILSSDDQGKTWQKRGELAMSHARLFSAGGKVYYLGHRDDLQIAVSDDDGQTWSGQTALTEGQSWHQSACNVWHRNGNVYLVMERITTDENKAWPVGSTAPVLMRGKAGTDLTKRENWTFASELVFADVVKGYKENRPELEGFGVPFFAQAYPTRAPLGNRRSMSPMGWLETNVVQITDPDQQWFDATGRTFHLFMRAHTGGTGYAALAKVIENEDGSMVTTVERAPSGQTMLFLPFPGGQMRFHVLYDEQTKLYWMLGSQATDSMRRVDRLPEERYDLPNNERHRMVLHFSKNMVDWCFAGVVAQTDSPKQARHYASMDFDGDDLVILSRSGDERAKSAHDGNLITFHRVKNFRELVY